MEIERISKRKIKNNEVFFKKVSLLFINLLKASSSCFNEAHQGKQYLEKNEKIFFLILLFLIYLIDCKYMNKQDKKCQSICPTEGEFMRHQ